MAGICHPSLRPMPEVSRNLQFTKLKETETRSKVGFSSNYDFHSSVSSKLCWKNLIIGQPLKVDGKPADWHSYLEFFTIKSQPYNYHTIFCHRPPPPDNSTNYVLSLPTYIKHPTTLPSLHPATLHYQVYQICFFSVSDTKTYIYAVNNIDILHIMACCLL